MPKKQCPACGSFMRLQRHDNSQMRYECSACGFELDRPPEAERWRRAVEQSGYCL